MLRVKVGSKVLAKVAHLEGFWEAEILVVALGGLVEVALVEVEPQVVGKKLYKYVRGVIRPLSF